MISNLIQVGTIVFCIIFASSGYASSLPAVTVQLPWFLSVEWAGIIMAKEKGFDKKYGVSLSIRNYRLGEDPVKNVTDGNADIGIIDAANLIIKRSQGFDVTAIWAQMQTSPVGICSLSESGIKKINNIAGKKFGIQPEYEYLLDIFLTNGGLSKSDIKVVHIEGDPVTALEKKQVDAAACYDIYQAPLLRIRGHNPHVIRSHELGFDFYDQVLFITGDTNNKRRSDIDSALRAIHDGWLYALDNIDDTVRIITSRYRPFDPKEWLLKTKKEYVMHQTASLKLVRYYMMNNVNRQIGIMRKKRWLDSIALLYRQGVIETPLEPEQLFTRTYLKTLIRKSGHL